MKKLKPTEKTIAVLPFLNMSGSDDIEYFSDGITEEIINALARIEQLKVTSRTSSFYFKNKQIPVRQIAQELNVVTILEGSVRLAANTVRITAQLIHAEEDFHFWSETWDRKLENIFEIQDEISLLIAEKLREQYGHLEIQDRLVEKKTESIEAYEYFLKGRFHFNKWNPVDGRKAIEFFEKAVELDPNHTDSYVGLADAWSFFAVTELMPREEAWQKSRKYMDKAYSLNPEHSGVHYLLANFSFFYNADFQEAFKHGLRSVELKSNYPEAQQFVSMLYMILGENEKAKHHLEIAHSIDPLSQETLFYRAYFHYRTEDYPEALKLYDQCLANNPHNIPAYIVRSYCLLKMGRF
ncbi:MAG: tetratricopeptide repeat protein, partial [Mariniphaga sp.]|nr:tetratricopeptide repeat protein [Mariniphaga sp.]